MHFHSRLAWRSSGASLRLAVAAIALSLALPAPGQTKPRPANPSANSNPSSNSNDDELYRNPTFGFRYQIPYGWVDRTPEMQSSETQNGGDAGTKNAGKGEVLLALFERPPQAVGESVNSAVVIAAESLSSYPGLKTADDYLAPLTELATANGFHVEDDPYDVEIDSHHLLRADFIKPLRPQTDAKINDKSNPENLSMHQCTLVLLAKSKNKILSFTFIAGSEDELDELISDLHFAPAKSPSH